MAKAVVEEKAAVFALAEPVIRCPNCQRDIKLTESLAKPLLDATRQEFEAKLAQKENEAQRREEVVRERELALDQKIAETIRQEREKIAADEAKKAKAAAQADLAEKQKELADLQEILKQRDEKLAEAQNAQADLLRQKRELTDAKREVGLSLRHGLIETHQARQASEGQQTKMEMVYQYLTGPKFRLRIQAIVEAFNDMEDDLKAEKKAIMKQWAKREEQIGRVVEATTGMFGELQGIAGKSLKEIEGLQLPDGAHKQLGK